MARYTNNDSEYDAVIVGAGPNGLAAAITLARAGKSVLVIEAKETVGGGSRSAELTLPGFVHDICSAIHPLARASPFFRSLPLHEHGLSWIEPPVQLAHPLDDGTAVAMYRSIEATSENLGRDAKAYSRLMTPLVRDWRTLEEFMLGPFSPSQILRHPLALTRFGALALLPARPLANLVFRGERGRAVFAGMAAHSMLPLDRFPSGAAGLQLALLAHAVGWPLALGGSQTIVDSMASYLKSLGGEVVTGVEVHSLPELPPAGVVLFDVTPRQLTRIAGEELPAMYRRRLGRYRYGSGVFKVDFALSGPVPWRAPECTQAATVHVGGTFEEIAAAEKSVWQGRSPERPFVLVGQQSLFDTTRAPSGMHTLWAYCHVPSGSTFDMTERIEAQIERFAPGFRDLILAKHVMGPRQMEAYNPNYIGGDINGGVQDLRQLFTRPLPQRVPYRTANRRIFLCSSSTPPGGGVHGMCGYYSAKAALRDCL
jgi:phytoene dehydrogenase-like protein